MNSAEEKMGTLGLKLVQDIFAVHNFWLHKHSEDVLPSIKLEKKKSTS